MPTHLLIRGATYLQNYMRNIFSVCREISRAPLAVASSCLIPASESLLYEWSLPNTDRSEALYDTLFKCYDKNCLHRDRNDKRTSLSQWSSGDWQDIRGTSLANHRDAELLFRGKRSGARMLAARCCHVATETGNRVEPTWFECFDCLMHFGTDEHSSVEISFFYIMRSNVISKHGLSLREMLVRFTEVSPNALVQLHSQVKDEVFPRFFSGNISLVSIFKNNFQFSNEVYLIFTF